MKKDNPRYKTEIFHVKSLEQNPLNAPVERPFFVYLPPGYYETKEKRYPTIYLLHGYGQDISDLIVGSKKYVNSTNPFLLRLLACKVFKNMLTYEKLDKLILDQSLPPFILIQPECSLKIPDISGAKKNNGLPSMKGAFYLNSQFTGNYSDFIFEDLIEYIDKNYRTIPDKQHRALMGGSMGGYGTLYGCLKYPDKFQAAVALSPSISFIDLLEIKMIVPIYKKIYGAKKAEKMGSMEMEDIFDTTDLIFSHNSPLIPTIERNTDGKIIKMDESSKENWLRGGIDKMTQNTPKPFNNVQLLINCEKTDEYEFAAQIDKFHNLLIEMGVNHEIDIYSDELARKISPHMVGIALHVLPGIEYCLKYIP